MECEAAGGVALGSHRPWCSKMGQREVGGGGGWAAPSAAFVALAKGGACKARLRGGLGGAVLP